MDDPELFVHSYLTTFAPEIVAIGLNALVYAVIRRSEKLQHSALIRKDVALNIVVSGVIAMLLQVIANFSRHYLNLHNLTCTGGAYISQVSIAVVRCAVVVAAFNRYISVGGASCGLADFFRGDLTIFLWLAPAILESPTLLSFGIEDGICGFLHAHLAMIYIAMLTVMAVAPLFVYGIILQLTLSAIPETMALSEEQMVLRRSTKISRGVIVGGMIVYLPAQLWNIIVDDLALSLTGCFFISHILLIAICISEVICFAFIDPVFQLEYKLHKVLPDF